MKDITQVLTSGASSASEKRGKDGEDRRGDVKRMKKGMKRRVQHNRKTGLQFFFIYTFKGYWPRNNKNTLEKKSRFSLDTVKKTVGEIETRGGGLF